MKTIRFTKIMNTGITSDQSQKQLISYVYCPKDKLLDVTVSDHKDKDVDKKMITIRFYTGSKEVIIVPYDKESEIIRDIFDDEKDAFINYPVENIL